LIEREKKTVLTLLSGRIKTADSDQKQKKNTNKIHCKEICLKRAASNLTADLFEQLLIRPLNPVVFFISFIVLPLISAASTVRRPHSHLRHFGSSHCFYSLKIKEKQT